MRTAAGRWGSVWCRYEFEKHVLKISSVEVSDSGRYVCCAENDHGQTCSNFTLLVHTGLQSLCSALECSVPLEKRPRRCCHLPNNFGSYRKCFPGSLNRVSASAARECHLCRVAGNTVWSCMACEDKHCCCSNRLNWSGGGAESAVYHRLRIPFYNSKRIQEFYRFIKKIVNIRKNAFLHVLLNAVLNFGFAVFKSAFSVWTVELTFCDTQCTCRPMMALLTLQCGFFRQRIVLVRLRQRLPSYLCLLYNSEFYFWNLLTPLKFVKNREFHEFLKLIKLALSIYDVYDLACIVIAIFLPSVLWRCWLGGRKGIRPVKTEWWGASVVICLERGANLHMAQLMPLPLTVSCFSKIQIGFAFLVPAHLGDPGKGAVKRVSVW